MEILLLMLLMMSMANVGNLVVHAEHVTTDVIIIGAGISGITLSNMCQPKLSKINLTN